MSASCHHESIFGTSKYNNLAKDADWYKVNVSVKHSNLLYKIMLAETCFVSNESLSGHPNELIQGITYIKEHSGIPNPYNE